MIKILTVDDEKEFTDMIKNYFEPRGYNVLIAAEGAKAVEMARAEKPEIALIDLKMPGMHGDQVMAEVEKVSPDTISIMITASEGELQNREKLLRMGAYECFDKPLTSLKDLEEKIKEALGEA